LNALRSDHQRLVESVGTPAAVPHPARRPRMVIAANAVPGQGGQGLNLQHMAEGLCEGFELLGTGILPRPTDGPVF
jgi:hypothetical protein